MSMKMVATKASSREEQQTSEASCAFLDHHDAHMPLSKLLDEFL
jgi:hypothetical protein